MVKIMHLLSTKEFSGAENVVCQIMNCYKGNREYEMLYVSRIEENQESLDERNIRYHKLEKFDYANVKKAIKMIKPDIIHAHDVKASIIASLFYKKAKIISHIHVNDTNMRKIGIKPIMYNLVSKRISKIIWVSKSSLEDYIYKEKIKNKSIVLSNVINSKEIYKQIAKDNNEYDQYDIIFFGRLSFQKDPLKFVEVIKNVSKKVKIRTIMIGDGELRNDVEKCVNGYNLQEVIDIRGFVCNPYKILNNSKILIMTSRYEGTPMVALEALALNKPIIATATDGLKDIIENNQNGYIINSTNEMAEKVIDLINNQNKYKQLCDNAKKYNSKFNDIVQYKEKLSETYNEVDKMKK